MMWEDTVLFAQWEGFWLTARWIWMFQLTHEHFPDDNERMEEYWPCSDKTQFWPVMLLQEDTKI